MKKVVFRKSRKRLLVALLSGPRKPVDLVPKYVSAYTSLYSAQKVGLIQKTSKGWMLTVEGTRLATQFSYDLKLANSHPDQEPTVTAPPQEVQEPSEDALPEPSGGYWLRRHIDFLEETVRSLTANRQP